MLSQKNANLTRVMILNKLGSFFQIVLKKMRIEKWKWFSVNFNHHLWLKLPFHRYY